MSEYNQRLIEWTNMKEEKQYTFTITEDDLQRPHSGPHLKSIKHPSRSMSYSEGDLRKYQALPPIGITEISQSRTNYHRCNTLSLEKATCSGVQFHLFDKVKWKTTFLALFFGKDFVHVLALEKGWSVLGNGLKGCKIPSWLTPL